jgi:uncharacterized protein YndB with AHSA1/START domain
MAAYRAAPASRQRESLIATDSKEEEDMADIRHRVGIAAPPARVYEALTTTEGLSGWWTRIVEGDPTHGGTLRSSSGSQRRVP